MYTTTYNDYFIIKKTNIKTLRCNVIAYYYFKLRQTTLDFTFQETLEININLWKWTALTSRKKTH